MLINTRDQILINQIGFLQNDLTRLHEGFLKKTSIEQTEDIFNV